MKVRLTVNGELAAEGPGDMNVFLASGAAEPTIIISVRTFDAPDVDVSEQDAQEWLDFGRLFDSDCDDDDGAQEKRADPAELFDCARAYIAAHADLWSYVRVCARQCAVTGDRFKLRAVLRQAGGKCRNELLPPMKHILMREVPQVRGVMQLRRTASYDVYEALADGAADVGA